MALQPFKLILHSRVVSNCCARVRIAASLKNIPLEIVETTPKVVNIKPSYLEKNPNAAVPILEAHYENGDPLIMTQSLSMLQFLEETYPSETRLIPPATDMVARSKVMDLALLVACDFQPLLKYQVLRTLKRFSLDKQIRGPRRGSPFSQDDEATSTHMKKVRGLYTKAVVNKLLKAYEDTAKHSAGKFSVGDKASIADICLAPMIQSIRMIRKLPLKQDYPTISRIMENCHRTDAFRLQGVPPRSKE